jgi:hypothetical protein
MDGNWQDWTSCEMYGHTFTEGRCSDCGEADGGKLRVGKDKRVRKITPEEAAAFRERVRLQNEVMSKLVVIDVNEFIEAFEGGV